MEDVARLVRLGRKIEAIKLYREIHGVDLKAAKSAVDAIVSHYEHI
jgi:ribosomal protein L7/L12